MISKTFRALTMMDQYYTIVRVYITTERLQPVESSVNFRLIKKIVFTSGENTTQA